ncbi:transporter substrate-binding domain-containing protein [Ferrimonas aestuarii]|uniref:Transporter substrate-binding domain-containing protein n=2 Tax=Ferrimonas aestuarii TaxID=2569539 RepID=A0A4U1BGM3_9GAMM|nr:transporter substrate-binding domain-containing protein [Ferrimonas aestuarii]
MLVACTLITATVAISLQYYFARKSELQNTLTQYQGIAHNVSGHLSRMQTVAENAAKSGAQLVSLIGVTEPKPEILLPLSKLLAHDSGLHSVAVALSNNNFFQLISLHSEHVRERVKANEGDAWLVVSHTGDKRARHRTKIFFDRQFQVRRAIEEQSNFLPTKRSWFENAIENQVYKSRPYLFHTMKESGESYSIKVAGTDIVVVVDVLLHSLEAQLRHRFVNNNQPPEAQAYIYQSSGQLIGSNRDNKAQLDTPPQVSPMLLTFQQQELVAKTPVLNLSNQSDWAPFDYSIGGRPSGYAVDLLKMVSTMTGLRFDFVNGSSWDELSQDYNDGHIDLLHSINFDARLSGTHTVGAKLFANQYALLVSDDNQQIQNLETIKHARVGLSKGWNIIGKFKAQYPDARLVYFDSVNDAINALEQSDVDAVLDVKQVLEVNVQEQFRQGLSLHPVTTELLSESFHYLIRDELAEVGELIDLALARITPSQHQQLEQKWFGATVAQSRHTFVPYKELLTFAGDTRYLNAVNLVRLNGKKRYLFIAPLNRANSEFLAIIVPKTYVMAGLTEGVLLSTLASVFVLALLLPLAWMMAIPISKPINALKQQVELINQRQFDGVSRVHSQIEESHQLGLAIHGAAQSFKQYERQQNELFDSMIELIAKAIDEKSPYTASHCRRVPELALMLAGAAEAKTEGSLANFSFANDDERREFRIACWLHDCGKIATPEHVVDKGTKLETNYNRIHEVRTRFEVLWRDLQIAHLLNELQIEAHEFCPEVLLNEDYQRLQTQFALIANSNMGSELMTDADIEQLRTIGEQPWTRYFDASLGLSLAEQSRQQYVATPAPETLLRDKHEHIIERQTSQTPPPSLGVTMATPTHLYNQGELYNLSVRRGTLTPEERYKINEHMITGIKLLEGIPFPPELKRVPRWATTHHETLIGDGYPRGLNEATLSIPERILAIADIFEALTASDRPYKSAKTLPETVAILHKMAHSGHIDVDLFELLLTSGVYLDYAKAFLPESEQQGINIAPYLAAPL